MTTNQLILVVAVVAIVALLAARGWRGGPRVTEIDIRREKDNDGAESDA